MFLVGSQAVSSKYNRDRMLEKPYANSEDMDYHELSCILFSLHSSSTKCKDKFWILWQSGKILTRVLDCNLVLIFGIYIMGKSCFFPWRDLNYGSFLQQLLTHIEKSLYETLVYSDPSKIDTAESLQIVSLKNRHIYGYILLLVRFSSWVKFFVLECRVFDFSEVCGRWWLVVQVDWLQSLVKKYFFPYNLFNNPLKKIKKSKSNIMTIKAGH